MHSPILAGQRWLRYKEGMSLWDKLSDARDLVKDEYQRHFGENDPYAKVGEAGAGPAPEVGFVPSVETADQAYARLGLSGGNTLD